MTESNSLKHELKFVYIYNIIHIDETLFYITKKAEKYYLLRDEEELLLTYQSKKLY